MRRISRNTMATNPRHHHRICTQYVMSIVYANFHTVSGSVSFELNASDAPTHNIFNISQSQIYRFTHKSITSNPSIWNEMFCPVI